MRYRKISPDGTFPLKSTGLFTLPLILLFMLMGIDASGQSNGPCDAIKWEDGSHWNDDGSIDDRPNSPDPGGIVRCATSAETHSNIQANSTYDPSVFMIPDAMPCVDPSTGEQIFLQGPAPGQALTWFQYDVRDFAIGHDFQVISNDNIGWALFYSNTPGKTYGPAPSYLTGDCMSLTYDTCGSNFTGWAATPYQTPNFNLPTNYYLAVWATDGSSDFNFNFKARFGCGDRGEECMIDCTNDTVSCLSPRASLEIPPLYLPASVGECGLDTIVEFVSQEVFDMDPCTSEFSTMILRTWALTEEGMTIGTCEDTTYVLSIDLTSNNLICEGALDSFSCSLDLDVDSLLDSRSPRYVIEPGDTIDLTGDLGGLCGVQVAAEDSDWPYCGNTRTIIRTWTLHYCDDVITCNDTIAIIDTTPPYLEFGDLNLEFHDFLGPNGEIINGLYHTDTVAMSGSECEAHGRLPSVMVSDSCSSQDDLHIMVLSASLGHLGNFTGGNPQIINFWGLTNEKEIVIYEVTDPCSNVLRDTVILVIEDQTPPTAACHGLVNLTLQENDLFTFLNSYSLNAQSDDNCYVYSILARRVDWETACGFDPNSESPIKDFYDQFQMWLENDGGLCQDVVEYGFTSEIPFCCDDVGQTIKVELLVIDQNCNVSKCWGMVYVEDKTAPEVLDPLADIHVNCNVFATNYASYFIDADTQSIRAHFGEYVQNPVDQQVFSVLSSTCENPDVEFEIDYEDGLLVDNCGGLFRERYTVPGDGCWNDPIIREFIAVLTIDEMPVEYVYATQKIYVEKCPLSASQVIFPNLDTTFYNCGISYESDGNTSFQTNGPELLESAIICGHYGIGYYDKVFQVLSGEGCYKVARTWCIADWCQVDNRGGWIDMSKDPSTLTFVQYILVKDTLDPELSEVNISVDLVEDGCLGLLEAEVDATDNCAVDPSVNWILKNGNGQLIATGIGTKAMPADLLPPGDYILLWRAVDQCGNRDELVQQFTISANESPSVIAHNSLTAILTPLDTNLNGIVDMGQIVIWAKEFNSSSAPACGGSMEDIIFLIEKGHANPMSLPPGQSQMSVKLTCNDFTNNPTMVPLQFWVLDTVSNSADYINVYIRLFDNHNYCGGESQNIKVGSKASFVDYPQEAQTNPVKIQLDSDQESEVRSTRLVTNEVLSNHVLFQNRPNPFRMQTIIGFELPESAHATLRILDSTGKVLSSISGDYTRGYNEVIVDRSALTPGILYYELQSQFGKSTKRMILIE